MKITDIAQAKRTADRVNVSVDGKYRFSLDIFQVGELGIRIGAEYSEKELIELETESEFGKLYARALEYSLMRPHSAKEVRDYLWRKTLSRKYKTRDGQIKQRDEISISVSERVYRRLLERGYIDDEKFARFWVENRNQTKGSSLRKIMNELRAKGIDQSVIDTVIDTTERSDTAELAKVLSKKRRKYDDDQKLIQYLMRQGFRYDDIKTALSGDL